MEGVQARIINVQENSSFSFVIKTMLSFICVRFVIERLVFHKEPIWLNIMNTIM